MPQDLDAAVQAWAAVTPGDLVRVARRLLTQPRVTVQVLPEPDDEDE